MLAFICFDTLVRRVQEFDLREILQIFTRKMGGNSRKFKKAEKSKIKLKSSLKGAKLPKGTNVTKTNFKVRKIVIPDQIKQRNLTDANVLSSRSLTVKVSLGHHYLCFSIGTNNLYELYLNIFL